MALVIGTPADRLAPSLVELTRSIASAHGLDDLDRLYLDAIRRLIPTRAAGYYLLDPFTRHAEHAATVGVSDFFLARYERAGRPRDPVLARVLATRRPVLNRQLMSLEAWRSLDVYREVFSLQRMTVLLQAPVMEGDSVVGTLNFGDRDDAAPLDPWHIELAGALGRLVGVALHAIRERERLERERDQVVAALELCDDALVVADLRDGRRRRNGAARQLLERVEGAGDEGWLDDLMAEQRRADDVAVASARVGLRGGGDAVLRVQSVAPAPDVLVSFLSLDDARATRLPSSAERVLSPREREVAEQVARGLRDAEIAERLLLSPHTVKGYLKSVYRKLGVRSRVDLTALLLKPDVSSSPQPPIR
jgi:DNA-binding CsgD family transcriptional regulator/GAF domain-containing protein